MAVPKKRTSISKKNIRKNFWKKKGYWTALKAFSLGQSILTGKSKSFIDKNKEVQLNKKVGFGLNKKVQLNKKVGLE
uniref:Large ribosomal subunit protein bL32c n=1 Tax=Medicago tenoreana TaxID=66819 RepID=A0A898NAE7_9FABA|nr:ribosomal protein L32 [Medicago tenoreana]QSJ48628.1 ribosomal protein L32 [Medicago tenoreana]